MGFEKVIIPYYAAKKINTAKYGIKVIGAKSIKDAFKEVG
jgi:DNA repair protein RadA/Sms